MPLPDPRHLFRLAVRRAGDVDRDTDAEIEAHLALRVEALMADGLTEAEATTEALRRFGPLAEGRRLMVEAARGRDGRLGFRERFDAIVGELRHTLGQMRRAPGFTAAVIVTFGAGIGANATMFGVIDRLLLRPPAGVRSPEQVYVLKQRRMFAGAEYSEAGFSYPAYLDFRDQVPALSDVAMQTFGGDLALGRGAEAQKVRGVLVTGNYFTTLGVTAAIGRLMGPDDTASPGAPVAVISYGFWQRHFGGTADVVGRVLEFGPTRLTVIGVTPRGFNGVGFRPIEVWVPVTTYETLGPLPFIGKNWSTARGATWLSVVARLRPGATAAQAVAQLATAFRQGQTAARADTTGRPFVESIVPLRKGEWSQETKVASLLAAVALLVLTIACANVANLLLARAVRRRRETAVRLALGISKGRLAAQFLVESVTLALVGGGAALVVAQWGGALLRRTLLAGLSWPESAIDGRLLAFTAVAAIAVGLATGALPLIQSRGLDLSRALREGSVGAGHSKGRLRTGLLLTQGVLAVVLLVGTGLFLQSLRNLGRIRLGFDAEKVIAVNLDLGMAGFDETGMEDVYQRLEQRFRTLPGIAHASLGEGTSFGWSLGMTMVVPGIDSLPIPPGAGPNLVSVSDDFFETMGTRVIRGRPITKEDRSSGARVALVNQDMARRVWKAKDPIGTCIKIATDSVPCNTIIGVVEDTHQSGVVEERTTAIVYVPITQGRRFLTGRTLLIRPAGPPEAMIETIRQTIQATVPDLPYPEVRVMHSMLDPELRPWRLGAAMFGAFGGLALLVTAVGLYGVIGYLVGQRMREMGIRMALGAESRNIIRLVLGYGLQSALVSALVGTGVALALGHWVRPLLFQVSPADPIVLGAVVALLLLVATAASIVPAIRATRAEVMSVLRSD